MFIDISRTLSPNAVVFPGDDQLEFVDVAELSDVCRFAKIGINNFSGHVMSHVDAPSHVLEGGKSIDQFAIGDFVFDAVVHEVVGDVIDRSVVEQLTDVRGKAVLFKTRGSTVGDTDPFAHDFVYITADGAEALVEHGIAAVGIDYLSIDSIEDHIAHHTLLSKDIFVFEALQLKDAKPGAYKLFAFPLKIEGGDGSCVRAVLQAS